MGRIADRVYTDQTEITRLELRTEELPDEAVVELMLVDGTRVTGVVVVRPTIQTFRDPEGCEGINGLVRIDELHSGHSRYLWLDSIQKVTALGSA